MAAIWIFRAALVIEGFGVRYVQSGQPPPGQEVLIAGRQLLDRLRDPSESDGDLGEALSDANGYAFQVATYSGSFELRRVQCIWSMISATGIDEDSRICTFDLAKISGGSVVDTWDGADFTAVQAAFDTWWAAIRPWFPSGLHWRGLKVYKVGPDVPETGNVAVYTSTVDVAGSSAFNSLPPQVALSVTEKAGSKLHWGRFYLPAPAVIGPSGAYSTTAGGRPLTTMMTTIGNATEALYEGQKTAGREFVVYRRELPQRGPAEPAPWTTKGSTVLPARDASAWTVESVQIDDVFDVIRSRRYDAPQLRVQNAIT